MDVADWLRKLGLEQYEPAFRENDVDEQVLPRLTAEDLISIGVTSVGHRRRLLDAIAALTAEVSAALERQFQIILFWRVGEWTQRATGYEKAWGHYSQTSFESLGPHWPLPR